MTVKTRECSNTYMSYGIYHVVSRSYFSVRPPMKLAHIHKHKKYLDNYRRLGSLVQQLKIQCNCTTHTVTEGQL